MPCVAYQATARRRKPAQACLLLAGQHLRVGQAGVVVDGDVQVLPAGPAAAIDPVLEDAFSDHVEAAQLLGIDVHQLARPCPLIPDDRIALGARQARAPPPPQHLPHRRRRPTRDDADHQRAGVRPLAQRHDLALGVLAKPARLAMRRRAAITQRCPPALAVAPPQPIPSSSAGAAGGRGRLRPHPPKHQPDHLAPRLDRIPHPTRRLHRLHHPGPPCELWTSTSTRLAGGPDNVSRLAGVWSIQLARRFGRRARPFTQAPGAVPVPSRRPSARTPRASTRARRPEAATCSGG